MKKYLFLLVSTIMIFLAGCGSSNSNSEEVNDLEPTIYETVNNLDGVTMEVKGETVSPNGLTVTIENHSDKQCIYGEDFILEKNIEDNWYQVPVSVDGDYGFNAIGFELNPTDVLDWTVDWEWLHGDLDAGDYRIVKSILDFRGTGDYDEYHLAANFSIE